MQGEHVGQSCVIDNSPGVCRLIADCPKVYADLVAGNPPTEICGFVHFEPIICCPSTNVVQIPTPGPQTTINKTTTASPIWKSNGTVGYVARAKCAENTKEVYSYEIPPTHHKSVKKTRCIPTARKLIIGGKKAEAREFPHMAAVGFDGPENKILWNCGGSLISAKIVLTAAHCTMSLDWGNATWVRVGILNLAQTNQNTQTIAIKERINHPDYIGPSEYHDIAILRLEHEVTYSAWVRPACLPVDWPDEGQTGMAIATGWGVVDWADDKGSDNLLKVTLNLVSHETCNASFFDGGSSAQLTQGVVDEWQICAGEPGKDTCQGDSGGPLAIHKTVDECMYNIIGVTSLGRLCGSIIPGVYTRVHHYISWIEKTAWPEHF